jgi:hypothetical protein
MPASPTSPTSGTVNTNYTYSVGGSADGCGDQVQYQIDWGDGTVSGWLPVGTVQATHAWSAAGTYYVSVQARSATNGFVLSGISSSLPVTIQGAGSGGSGGSGGQPALTQAVLHIGTAQSYSGVINWIHTVSFVTGNDNWSFLGGGELAYLNITDGNSGTSYLSWPATTNNITLSLDPSNPAAYKPGFTLQFWVYRDFQSGMGTIELSVYGGISITLTYADGTSQTVYPTGWSIQYTNGGPPNHPLATYIANARAAAGSDPNAYATIVQANDEPIVISVNF